MPPYFVLIHYLLLIIIQDVLQINKMKVALEREVKKLPFGLIRPFQRRYGITNSKDHFILHRDENGNSTDMDKSSSCSEIEYMNPTNKSALNQYLSQRKITKESKYDSKKILAQPSTKINGIKLPDKLNQNEASTKVDFQERLDVAEKSKSGTNDPSEEESLSKIIAKRIQEIPGVDGELRKVEDIRIKMMSILLNIKNFISKNSDLSSLPLDEDYERIHQRTIEFGARFKRNYFYRTKCQLNELKSMEINPLLLNKKSKVIAIIQKLSAAHQGILQSLQVIGKQLQTISVFGLTQEDFFVFYRYIYELTFMLKPFYGFKNTQVLDDVEKLVLDTTRLLRELKCEQEMSKSRKPRKTRENKVKGRTKVMKEAKLVKFLARKKSPYANKLVKKPSKQSVGKNEEKIEENKEDKGLNFMMNIKQRPGAEVRVRHRVNYNTQEPKTMVEMLAENELNAEESLPTVALLTPEIEPEEASLPASILKEVKLSELNETFPKNVKLVTIKRIESSDDIRSISNHNQEARDIDLWADLNKYKEEFKVYKKANPLYNKKSLQTVKSMTEKLLDEALSDSLNKVLNTINIQDLSALKNIMEEEIK